MQQKTILITGCTAGIGLETARALAHQGHHLILVSRNAEKLAALKTELIEKNNIPVEYFACDFANLGEVAATAKEIAQKYQTLDILINNAGIYSFHGPKIASGFEQTWTINYFAPFILTHHLLPLLKKTAQQSHDVRIINVASEAHKNGSIDFDFTRWQFQITYGSSKLANILYTARLSRELAGTGITVNSLHPGVVATELWRDVPQPFSWALSKIFITPIEGAKTTIYLATVENLTETGKYYSKSKLATTTRLAQDIPLQDKLYDFTLKEMSMYL